MLSNLPDVLKAPGDLPANETQSGNEICATVSTMQIAEA